MQYHAHGKMPFAFKMLVLNSRSQSAKNIARKCLDFTMLEWNLYQDEKIARILHFKCVIRCNLQGFLQNCKKNEQLGILEISLQCTIVVKIYFHVISNSFVKISVE